MTTERRCTELTAVYDDGQVERWEGQDLGGCLAPLRVYDKAKTHTETTEDGEPYDSPDTVLPTITKPLRKVTLVRGRYLHATLDDPTCIEDRAGDGHYMHNIVPEPLVNTRGRDAPLCDFRIEVQAVPVDAAVPPDVERRDE